MSTNGLRVGVTDLLRHPGERRVVEREVDLPGLAISTARVPDGEPVVVELEIESLSTELAVYGTVRAPFVGECRRCLRDVRGVVQVDVREIFELHPTEGETYLLSRDVADLEPMVRDAVLLALPLAPLCADDCRGPAPDQFPAEVEPDDDAGGGDGPEVAASPDERPPDPRWAALDQLHLD
jgi:uncharacterized protein